MAEWRNDIYEWKKGKDNKDVEILALLNRTIDGLWSICVYDYQDMVNEMNVGGSYQRLIKNQIDENLISDAATMLENLRVLLFGSKIKYQVLQEHLEKHLDEYGYVPKEETNEE